jgi:hypothetical protein
MKTLTICLIGSSILTGPSIIPTVAQAEVEIRGEQFYINGKTTYEGRTWQGKDRRSLDEFQNGTGDL